MGNGIIRYLVESVLNVLYSRSDNCLICNSYLIEEEIICKQCKDKIHYCSDKNILTKNNVQIEYYSSAYYASTITELIRRLKYKSDFLAGEFLGSLLLKTISEEKIEFDLVTCVPMSKKALKKRGFNQSKFLAAYVSKNTNRKRKEFLIKKKDTKDQIGLDGANRWLNLENCFEAQNIKALKNKKIILIDDVVTTGATAFRCSEQLLKNGAEKVTILTAAKSRL